MPNLTTAFRSEVTRLARKELRGSAVALKKAVAAQRSEIAGLKRRIHDLEASVKRLSKASPTSRAAARAAPEDIVGNGDAGQLRFRPEGMAANRKRLGLSAADFGLLVGATGQSIYAWETGKTRPRPRAIAAIAALRGVGKREVAAKLAELKG